MAAKTHYLQHQFLASIAANARYLALFTSSPTDAGLTTAEVSGNGYARQNFAWSSAADQANGALIGNAGAITFPAATGPGWGTVTHVAVFDAATGGNMWLFGPLPSSLSVPAATAPSYPAGTITYLEQ